jgi:hypothetical protein
MDVIAEYRGNMLNHVEALYRTGDRDIAIELGEVLGCVVVDTGIDAGQGSTFLAVHPNPDDLDVDNNAFYLSEITPEHAAVEAALEAAGAADARLRDSVALYREKALNWPFSIPHFGLRYQSEAEIEAVAQRLARASDRLKARARAKIIRPGDEGALTLFTQGFVHQDVVVAGSFLLGQLIELQYQAPEKFPPSA